MYRQTLVFFYKLHAGQPLAPRHVAFVTEFKESGVFLKNQWKNVSRGMDKMAEKKAAKGRRALEVLLRRLGKGLVRFVDNELQGGGGGGGGGGGAVCTW